MIHHKVVLRGALWRKAELSALGYLGQLSCGMISVWGRHQDKVELGCLYRVLTVGPVFNSYSSCLAIVFKPTRHADAITYAHIRIRIWL